jgi:hypothetical protein
MLRSIGWLTVACVKLRSCKQMGVASGAAACGKRESASHSVRCVRVARRSARQPLDRVALGQLMIPARIDLLACPPMKMADLLP